MLGTLDQYECYLPGYYYNGTLFNITSSLCPHFENITYSEEAINSKYSELLKHYTDTCDDNFYDNSCILQASTIPLVGIHLVLCSH
jgi:hypothetical protein